MAVLKEIRTRFVRISFDFHGGKVWEREWAG